eukprot:scaffold168055_cov20-Prasinocladus_malaysianus.AAC.1
MMHAGQSLIRVYYTFVRCKTHCSRTVRVLRFWASPVSTPEATPLGCVLATARTGTSTSDRARPDS